MEYQELSGSYGLVQELCGDNVANDMLSATFFHRMLELAQLSATGPFKSV